MILLRNKTFAVDNREDVPDDIMKKVEESGVIQQDHNGDWRIINKRKKKFWDAHYKDKASAKGALAGYHMHKHGG